jgi:hypothetical protein
MAKTTVNLWHQEERSRTRSARKRTGLLREKSRARHSEVRAAVWATGA